MRIVFIADTHLRHGALAVPAGDVLVHAGDMCESGYDRGRPRHLRELPIAAKWLRSLPHARKIVIAGNHDWAFQRDPDDARAALGPGIDYLRDSGVAIGGIRFWGSPWQPEFCGWAFNLRRGAPLAAKWALIPEGTDVLVTHGPPRGIGDMTFTSGPQGCDDLRERVRVVRPRIHVFGHIHEDGGAWEIEGTLFANVTTWECTRGATVIEIDPRTKEVRAIEAPPPGRA